MDCKITVRACWQLQIPCREVKLNDSYESNSRPLTSFQIKMSLRLIKPLSGTKCIKCKAATV